MITTRCDQTLHRVFVHVQLSGTQPPLLRRVPLLLVFIVGFLLFSLGACSAGSSSTPVTTQATADTGVLASPTPTRLPAGTVLYQSDWTQGLGGWQGAQGWKVMQGQLESDSSGSAAFTIPYQLTVSDYAVEIHLQIVRLLRQYGGYFSIFAPKAPGKDGYQAGASGLEEPGPRAFGAHPQSHVFLDPGEDASPNSGIPQDYEPGFGWHMYRVEVQGNEARLLDNGVEIGSASSQKTDVLSNGPIGFTSELVILRVSSVRVLAL